MLRFQPDTWRQCSLELSSVELFQQAAHGLYPAFACRVEQQRQELHDSFAVTREDKFHVLGYVAIRESWQRLTVEDQPAPVPKPAITELDAIEPDVLLREGRAYETVREL